MGASIYNAPQTPEELMKSRLAWASMCAAALLTTAGARTASAQAALDDDDDATERAVPGTGRKKRAYSPLIGTS